MKLVRFDDGKTGLLVQIASGPHVIDIIGSLGALSPDDPISQGILNGILKDKGGWAPLIEHWEQARIGLRRLALCALANPDRPDLVIYRADEVRLALPLRNPRGIVTLDIEESSEVAQDPTGHEAMERQWVAPSLADTHVTPIIPLLLSGPTASNAGTLMEKLRLAQNQSSAECVSNCNSNNFYCAQHCGLSGACVAQCTAASAACKSECHRLK